MFLQKNKTFSTSLIIIFLTIIFSLFIFLHFINVNFLVGQFRFSHWLVWIGTLIIAIFTPTFFFLKRRFPTKLNTLLNIHVFGFLISFMFVTIHFAGQLSRPQQFFPELGDGIALYITMFLLVLTGFIHRFHIIKKQGKYYPPHSNRFFHVSLTLTFYIIIIVHILVNTGIL